MKNQAYHFLKYADKVYKLSRALESLSDGREWAHVPLESVLTSVILGLVCRLGSLNQIEAATRNSEFDKVLGPALLIGMRKQEKGEGELNAGISILKELYWRNTRFCDVIVADALYAKAPFINEVTSQGKWVVIRVKQHDYLIVKDAEGLFAGRAPDFEKEGIEDFKGSRYDIKIWDEEGFTSWDGVRGSLRCLKVEEVRHSIKNGRPVTEENTSYIVTTCPKALVRPLTVWKIMHARWDIENRVFHEAKTYCSLDHCFIHDEVATEVFWMLQVIALNLLLLFKWRALREKSLTLLELARAILVGLAQLPEPLFKDSG